MKQILIHIGKSGGRSFKAVMKASDVIFDETSHIFQPPINLDYKYFIVTRSPIARALSAFNWRYHLVIETEIQSDRFPGERQILAHYETLNSLAEALYFADGSSNILAQGNFRSIHHLGESISFYLAELLAVISPKQIEGVFSQECLSQDSEKILGVKVEVQQNFHRTKTPAAMLVLSDQAKSNLVRYLKADFDCMDTLDKWGTLSPEASAALVKEKLFS